jgi:hypothetical protein
MAKKVKRTEGSNALIMDEVDPYDNLSLDGTSQGGETEASQDASDYEDDDPRSAPVRLHFGPDWCHKLFQLSKDEAKGVIRVCVGPEDCKRNGHKKATEQGEPGVYDTIKTMNYVDRILSLHRTLDEQKKQDATHKVLLDEATRQITGSKSYQERIRAVERELGTASDDDPTDWDDNIAEDNHRIPAKEGGPIKKGTPRVKTESNGKTRRSLKPQATTNEASYDAMTDLVKEVKEALKEVAVSMGHLAKSTQGSGRLKSKEQPDPDSEDSSDEDPAPKSLKKEGGKGSDPKKTPTKSKWYYAVARGRVPGVYT